jgi:uncharacterized membrane protein YkoI
MSTNFLSKKVLVVVAILAVGTVSAVLVASSIAQATAAQQERQKMMSWWLSSPLGNGIPQINGSINLVNETSNFISKNVKVSFVQAAETAQGQVNNGRVLGGHLGVMQGYLVYTFFTVNTTNQTGHLAVVDAGNGKVLYTSQGLPIGAMGPMAGHWGGPGYGEWQGPWMRHGWGMWH